MTEVRLVTPSRGGQSMMYNPTTPDGRAKLYVDFSNLIPDGVTITDALVEIRTSVLSSVADDDADDRLIGDPEIDIAENRVYQFFDGGIQDVDYELTFLALYSDAQIEPVIVWLPIRGLGYDATFPASGSDTTPDAFAFVDQSNATLSTAYTSNTITVTGIDAPASIAVSGGTYSKNGGAFTSFPGSVVSGDTIQARGTSSGFYSTGANVAISIGGVSDTFTITTITDPGLFTPSMKFNDTRNSQYTSLVA